jgi:hypothetical protein
MLYAVTYLRFIALVNYDWPFPVHPTVRCQITVYITVDDQLTEVSEILTTSSTPLVY